MTFLGCFRTAAVLLCILCHAKSDMTTLLAGTFPIPAGSERNGLLVSMQTNRMKRRIPDPRSTLSKCSFSCSYASARSYVLTGTHIVILHK